MLAAVTTLQRLYRDIRMRPERRRGTVGIARRRAVRTFGEQLEGRELLSVGLDPTFGFGGLANVPTGPGQFYNLNQVVTQPNGNIVAVGTFTTTQAGITTTQMAVVQFSPDGSILGSRGFPVQISNASWNTTGAAIAQQADGSIIVGGTATNPTAPASRRFVVEKLDSNLNPFFPQPVTIPIADPTAAPGVTATFAALNGVAVTPSGAILAVGDATTVNGGSDVAVAALSPNGTIVNGTGTAINLGGNPATATNVTQDHANAAVALGEIFWVAGDTSVGTVGNPAFHSNMAVMAFNNTGAQVTTVGSGGVLQIPFLNLGASSNNNSTGNAIAVGPQNRIVVVGTANVSSPAVTPGAPFLDRGVVAQINAGAPNAAVFAVQVAPLPGGVTSSSGDAVTVLPDGSILVGGFVNGGSLGGMIAKLTPAGALATNDPNFGPSGVALLPTSGITGIAAGPDGRIAFTTGTNGVYSTTAPVVTATEASLVLSGRQPSRGRRISGVQIKFNTRILNTSMVTNKNAYAVRIPGRRGRNLPIRNVSFDQNTNTLTITLRQPIQTSAPLQVTITPGGIANRGAQVLNNGDPQTVTVIA